MKAKEFQTKLLSWYDEHHRVLPWRDNPTPYRVWISEIMLQQTRVETVIPYFNRFIETLPTIQDVANASIDELNKLWEGLGYYSRVRNIQKAAQIIIEQYNGIFPSDYDDMLSLPGIGPYTAGAISSIAFNHRRSAVDGNVLRVFSRLYAITDNIKDLSTKKTIKNYVDSLLPSQRISEFNQALMEIGATVCLPKGNPKCISCPLQGFCIASKTNQTEVIPHIVRNIKRTDEEKTVVILKCNGKYGIRKRPKTGLLASLYEFDLISGHLSKNEIKKHYQGNVQNVFILENSIHKFSHKTWSMKGYYVILETEIDSFIWVTYEELIHTYSIPSAYSTYKKYIEVNHE